jgi:UDP-3-O-acyl N-acetylglucosamine deacetylase
MEMQRTISKEVYFKGIGLHTGNMCKAIFKPAAADTGVTFVRTDLPESPAIPAHYSKVTTVVRGTTVGNDVARVHTIEHVMSAIYALGIDNLLVELDANEPPVADGSSKDFFDTLKEAGFSSQNAPRQILVPQERIEYRQGETEIVLEPADALILTTVIIFNHPLIDRQEATIKMSMDEYRKEIAPARTFCFDYEVEALKKQGLARGGSLDNAVVVGLDRIHNKEKYLRFPNEFARHKALDLLGDLYLLGRPLKGHITATRCGHGHNINFVKLLAERLLSDAPLVKP